MRIKSLTYLVAALFLATGCAETMQDGGAGQGSGGNQQANTMKSSVKPGSGRDFVVNVGDRVFFGFDKSSLSSDARSQLEKQAAWLKKYGSVSLTLEGHADERGTPAYGLQREHVLASRRHPLRLGHLRHSLGREARVLPPEQAPLPPREGRHRPFQGRRC